MNKALASHTDRLSLITIFAAFLTSFPALAADATAASASSGAKTPSAAEWTVQLRGGLGGGRIAGEKNLKTDRLGAGVYGGKRLSDFELSLPFLKVKNTSAGAAYQTFTGVDASADRAWSIQSLGAQLRLELSPFADDAMDLALQGGASLQRLVSQEPLRNQETAKYGLGLSAAGYVRTLAFDGVHVIGGADVLLGSASWIGVSVGLESQF